MSRALIRCLRLTLPAARASTLLLGLLSGLLPMPAQAHGFGKTYTLPVPFWLYSYGAVAALVLTFVLAALLSREASQPQSVPPPTLRAEPSVLVGVPAILLWVVAIACGYFGVRNAFDNLNMTLFWVGFVLAVPYLSALFGNLNACANPFHALLRLAAASHARLRKGLLPYPKGLASWPALLLYMAFVSHELFGRQSPQGLSDLLLIYAGITLAGGLLFGAGTWLQQGECFTVLIRLLSLMAPRLWRDEQGRRHLRWPFAGLLDAQCADFSELVFLVFLLTATSFDGLHDSAPWVRLFWTDILQQVAPLLTPPLVSHYEDLVRAFGYWQQFWLLAMPFLYGLIYLACIHTMRWLTGTQVSVRTLALRFGLTLLPIILVYHVSHYLSLLVTQGTQLIPLLSDPLGHGWDLFSTATWVSPLIILPATTLWNAQVLLIVVGHGISVWLAHLEALRLFGNPGLAMRSQWPLLFLMLFLTVFGLWILAQPFSPPSAMQLLQSPG